MSGHRITVELTADQAAGLKRFAEKVGHSDALAVLYGHVSKDIRDEQAHSIICGFAALEKALADVPTFPWIETGVADR